MIISDLTYMETAAEEVVGAGFFFNKKINTVTNTNTNFNANSNVNVRFNKKARINVQTFVYGNSATFSFDNEAVGPNSDTETVVNQLTVIGQGSAQNGTMVSATSW